MKFHNIHRTFLGKTRSGKTWALQKLTSKLKRYLVYDIKKKDQWEGHVVTDFDDWWTLCRDSEEGINTKIVFKTKAKGRQSLRMEFDRICEKIWENPKSFSNYDIIIDEAAPILNQKDKEIPDNIFNLLLMGLSENMRLWISSQRFQWLEKSFITQCGEIYLFANTSEYDIGYFSKNYSMAIPILMSRLKHYAFVLISDYEGIRQCEPVEPLAYLRPQVSSVDEEELEVYDSNINLKG